MGVQLVSDSQTQLLCTELCWRQGGEGASRSVEDVICGLSVG